MAAGLFSCNPKGAFPFSFKVEVTPLAPLSAPGGGHVWRDPGAVTHVCPHTHDTAVTWAVEDSLTTPCDRCGNTAQALVSGHVSSLWAPATWLFKGKLNVKCSSPVTWATRSRGPPCGQHRQRMALSRQEVLLGCAGQPVFQHKHQVLFSIPQ